MDQEKIGNLLKKIRKENNLTQEKFAEKLGVTPQAVSKWELGKNIPDISVLKEIKKMYNIDLDSILDGENNKRKDKKIYIVIALLMVLIITLLTIILIPKNKNNFEFKPVKTTCDNFSLSGVAAYNNSKAALKIKIEYCGVPNDEVYEKIECTLYESYKDTIKKVDTCDSMENISLKEYLELVDIQFDHLPSTCKIFRESSVYLELNAINKDGITTTYKIPIELNDNC